MDRRQFLASAAAGIAAGASLARSASAVDDAPSAIPDGVKPAAEKAAATKPAAALADYAWHNVREWGVEGRAFDDTESYFDRLPARAKGVVREEVWDLSHDSTGMAVYFEAEADAIYA